VYGQLGDDEVHMANHAHAFVYGGYGADRVDATGSFATTTQDGGPGNDSLRGGPGEDWLTGGDGSDDLLADGGMSDDVEGGPGNDHVVTGGSDPDWVTLGRGDDRLDGSNTWLDFRRAKHGVVVDLITGRAVGEGHDTLSGVVGLLGTEFADRLIGTDQGEFIHGEGGNDRIEAHGGDDTINPGFGYDVVYAGPGDDHSNKQAYLKDELHLGPGNDYVTVGYGTDVWGGYGDDRIVVAPHITSASVVAGGPGIDSFRISSRLLGVLINLNTGRARVEDRMIDLSGFENATGTRNADTLIGSALANLLRGMGGNDTIDGRGGVDTADGGDGSDACLAETVMNCES
jgi:Ca2+-binding RTX toxin-like protein